MEDMMDKELISYKHLKFLKPSSDLDKSQNISFTTPTLSYLAFVTREILNLYLFKFIEFLTNGYNAF